MLSIGIGTEPLYLQQGRRKQFWSGPAKLYMKLQLKYCVKHNQQAKHAIARGVWGHAPENQLP